MRGIESQVEQQAADITRSPYERLRLNGAVRTAIITYGIGAFTYFFPPLTATAESSASHAAAGVVPMLVVGIGLQVLLLLVRGIAAGFGRVAGAVSNLVPAAMYVSELLVDGVTVLLFALATYRGIAEYASIL